MNRLRGYRRPAVEKFGLLTLAIRRRVTGS